MPAPLRYHQAVFDLLGQTPRASAERLRQIRLFEQQRGAAFPPSIVEWFALEGCETLFSANTTPDYLVALDDLADPDRLRQGYMPVAFENQGVVEWFARLDGADDPPIYGNNDHPDPAAWSLCSPSFSAFIRHMIAGGRQELAAERFRLEGEGAVPDSEALGRLLREFTAWPVSSGPTRRVCRLVHENGLLTIRASRPAEHDSWRGEWFLESGSPEALLALGLRAARHGALAESWRGRSGDPGERAAEEECARQLRGQPPDETA